MSVSVSVYCAVMKHPIQANGQISLNYTHALLTCTVHACTCTMYASCQWINYDCATCTCTLVQHQFLF